VPEFTADSCNPFDHGWRLPKLNYLATTKNLLWRPCAGMRQNGLLSIRRKVIATASRRGAAIISAVRPPYTFASKTACSGVVFFLAVVRAELRISALPSRGILYDIYCIMLWICGWG
jgi:hypothetical protein